MFEIGQTFTLSTPVTAEDAVQTALLSQDTHWRRTRPMPVQRPVIERSK
jgi:hypothetical protein